MASLAKQSGKHFFLKTFSSYLVNPWSLCRSVSWAVKHWQEFPPQDLLQVLQGYGFRGLLTGADRDEASYLLVLSPCSLRRGPVTSGICHTSQQANNNMNKREDPLFAALVFRHFLVRWPSWEQSVLKAEIGQGLWWDTQPGAGGWKPGQGQFSILWLIKP